MRHFDLMSATVIAPSYDRYSLLRNSTVNKAGMEHAQAGNLRLPPLQKPLTLLPQKQRLNEPKRLDHNFANWQSDTGGGYPARRGPDSFRPEDNDDEARLMLKSR